MTLNRQNSLFNIMLSRWRIIAAISVTLATGLLVLHSCSQYEPNIQKPVTVNNRLPATPNRVAITALGRLQPQGEITRLSAPNSINGVRVEKLLVKEGQIVKAGQVLAWLENYERSKAALQQSLDKMRIAQTELAQVKAGAKDGDVNAQQATISRLQAELKGETASTEAAIARLQAELDNAQAEQNRYQRLYKEGAVSASVADSKNLQLKTVQQQLREARASLNSNINSFNDQIREANARLTSIKEVRPVDIELAQANLKSAMTAVTQAKADHRLTYITSPINGKVLKIHAKKGEVIATSGFAEIGQTSQMYVLAEVYQTDIERVRLGQKATISSTAFSSKLQGTVSEVGLLVGRQNILSLNPGADTDRRVVEVKIRIDDPKQSQQVESLTNLQVDVAIQI
jgi:HlyD family secretion protein